MKFISIGLPFAFNGRSSTYMPELDQYAVGESLSSGGIHQNSMGHHEFRGVLTVGKDRFGIRSGDCHDDTHVWPEQTYVACSRDQNFPNVIRVYDANNFSGWFAVGHQASPSVKTRFRRACRAFVNAWRSS